ncbi:MAG: UvrD-helicase domain-containing protein [Planctomycetes bacterium]|nr:UvrD-helicase domain-containing protein [Planctomycetota bacterium]
MSVLSDLSDSQREAVTHIEGPLLVVAGAGSGKTRVITRRIAYLIDQGIEPQNILAITFTNKAAGEMRERIEQFCSDEGLWVSTFHSMCARILRREITPLGYSPSFTIYDENDSRDCVKQAMHELNVDTATFPPRGVRAVISNAKNDMLTPAQFAERAGGFRQQVVAQVFEKYAQILLENNALDFDDLLLKLAELFTQFPEVLRKYQERFRFVLVDEYQDTNRAQYVIAHHLADQHRNLCATGDPDQSIYAWRGADIRNILDFEEDYPDAKVVKLEQNYRSVKRILRAASEIIQHNTMRKERGLWSDKAEGDLLRLIRCEDEEAEANAIVEEIRGIVGNEINYSDIAIFYRVNAQSRAIEAALRDNGIPYSIVGGVEFYLRKEIKDILAYLRVCVNPADDLSLQRIINVPPRGIGAASLRKLMGYATSCGVGLYDAITQKVGPSSGVRGKAGEGVRSLKGIFEKLKNLPPRPVADIVKEAVLVTGYREHLGEEEEDRIENVEELVNAAAEYDRRNPQGDLEGFLEEVALISDIDSWEDQSAAVTLMTLHSAKGLEFPVVFISGLEEGLLPHQRSKESDEGVEEERRLCYVGITRAQEKLILTHARSRYQFGQTSVGHPSRFLDEIPDDIVEEVNKVRPEQVFRPMRETTTTWDFPDWHEFAVGESVRHAKFGKGYVLAVSGYGENRRARVKFPSGVKNLVLKHANLEKID